MELLRCVIWSSIIGVFTMSPGVASGAEIRAVNWGGINCLLVDAPVDLGTGDLATFVSLEIGLDLSGGDDPFFQTGFVDVAIATIGDAGVLAVGQIVGGYLVPDDGVVRIDLTPCQSWVAGTVRIVALIGALERNDGFISVALAQDKAAGNNLRIVGARGGAHPDSQSGVSNAAAGDPYVDHIEFVCSPNPARTGVEITIMEPEKLTGRGRLAVYDLRGRLIRTLPFGGAEKAEIWWDGRDASAMPVASGIYFLVAYSNDGKQHGKQKITLLR